MNTKTQSAPRKPNEGQRLYAPCSSEDRPQQLLTSISFQPFIFQPFVIALVLLTGSSAFADSPHFGHSVHHSVQHSVQGSTHANGSDVVIERFLSSFTGSTVPLHEATGEIKEFTLEIHEVESEIAPGVVVTQWAYGLAGQPATVPGPELRVKEGDLIRITLRNTHHQPHTIHLHGITTLAQQMDGVPHTSHQVLPGGSYTYEFVAGEPGTHAYHCHVQTYLHMDMGMYGALIIEPRDDTHVWDKDVTLILDEWDSHQDPEALMHQSNPNYYLVNGKAFPNIPPIHIQEGEVARIRAALPRTMKCMPPGYTPLLVVLLTM